MDNYLYLSDSIARFDEHRYRYTEFDYQPKVQERYRRYRHTLVRVPPRLGHGLVSMTQGGLKWSARISRALAFSVVFGMAQTFHTSESPRRVCKELSCASYCLRAWPKHDSRGIKVPHWRKWQQYIGFKLSCQSPQRFPRRKTSRIQLSAVPI